MCRHPVRNAKFGSNEDIGSLGDYPLEDNITFFTGPVEHRDALQLALPLIFMGLEETVDPGPTIDVDLNTRLEDALGVIKRFLKFDLEIKIRLD